MEVGYVEITRSKRPPDLPKWAATLFWSRATHPSDNYVPVSTRCLFLRTRNFFHQDRHRVEPPPVAIAAIAVDHPFPTIPVYGSANPHGCLQIVLVHAPDATTAVTPQGICCNVTFGLHASSTHYIRSLTSGRSSSVLYTTLSINQYELATTGR